VLLPLLFPLSADNLNAAEGGACVQVTIYMLPTLPAPSRSSVSIFSPPAVWCLWVLVPWNALQMLPTLPALR
jgi:hypothetical protein